MEKFLKQIDAELGTESEISFKTPQDILGEANRPSIKETKEWFDVEHVRDSLRFKTPVENLNDLPKIVEHLKDSGFEVVNLDLEKLLNPKARGWRTAAIDLRAPNGQLIEYQILPREMNEAGKIEHQIYKSIREKDVRKLTNEQRQQVLEMNNQARRVYSDAWEAYLRRTGQTKESITKFVQDANAICE